MSLLPTAPELVMAVTVALIFLAADVPLDPDWLRRMAIWPFKAD